MFGIDFFQVMNDAIEWSSHGGSGFVWVAIGSVLVLTGVGLPIPEDIPLTLAGFLTMQSGFFGHAPGLMKFSLLDYAVTLAFCTVCNLIGDSACYWLGKRYGLSIRAKFRFFRWLLPDDRMTRVEGWFTKYGGFTVFMGRQMAGVRFVTFFTSGVVRMPFWKFVTWDAVGCLLSIPIWLTLGGLGSVYRENFENWLRNTQTGVLIGGVALLVLAVIYFKFIRKRVKKADVREELHKAGLEHHVAVELRAGVKKTPTGELPVSPPAEGHEIHTARPVVPASTQEPVASPVAVAAVSEIEMTPSPVVSQTSSGAESSGRATTVTTNAESK